MSAVVEPPDPSRLLCFFCTHAHPDGECAAEIRSVQMLNVRQVLGLESSPPPTAPVVRLCGCDDWKPVPEGELFP